MRSSVNLVVIVLTLRFLASGHDLLDAPEREAKYSSSLTSSTRDNISMKVKRSVSVKTHRPAITRVASTRHKVSVLKGSTKGIAEVTKSATNVTAKTNKLALIHDLGSISKTDLELRDKRRRHKRRKNRAIMALLLAYKLKFAALIPVIAGGVIILAGTTALAGFFFALFAAVLGLKGH